MANESSLETEVSPLKKLGAFLSNNALYTVLVLLVGVIAFIDSDFLSLVVFRDILIQSSTRLIVAFGAFFAIVTAGADLSAGRMVGLAAVISASMLQTPDYPRP